MGTCSPCGNYAQRLKPSLCWALGLQNRVIQHHLYPQGAHTKVENDKLVSNQSQWSINASVKREAQAAADAEGPWQAPGGGDYEIEA